MVRTPSQVKYCLEQMGATFHGMHMFITCPICKRPNKIDRRMIADALKKIFQEQEKLLVGV